MAYFRYKVEDRKGKIRRGLEKADNAGIVMENLLREGLKIHNIRPVGTTELLYYRLATLFYEVRHKGGIINVATQKPQHQTKLFDKAGKFRPFARVGKESVTNFTRELATMLRSGIPLERSLSIIAESEDANVTFQLVLFDLLADIRKGFSFSNALAKQPKVFPPEYSGLTKVGEETGKMAEILDTLATELDRGYRLEKRVQSALVYPAFVVIVSVLSVFGIFLYVFPQILQILNEMRLSLPLCTKILLGTVQAVTNPYIDMSIVIIFLSISFLARSYFSTPVGQYNWGAAKFSIPLLGVLSNWLFAEKFCRIMSMFFKYNVPINTSLGMIRKIFRNPFLDENVFAGLQSSVMEGDEIDMVLRQNPLIPKMVANLVSVGVESGELSGCFHKAADMYEMEIEQMIQKLVAMIDPIIVGVLGLFIFFIVASIFLPLYQAIGSLGQ